MSPRDRLVYSIQSIPKAMAPEAIVDKGLSFIIASDHDFSILDIMCHKCLARTEGKCCPGVLPGEVCLGGNGLVHSKE